MKEKLLSYGGITVIVAALGSLILLGNRAEQAEARDRMRWEEVMEFRVALEQYRRARGTFPQNGVELRSGADEYSGLGKVYWYYPLPAGCAAVCDNYEIAFSLEAGTGVHEKGVYRADRNEAIRVGN